MQKYQINFVHCHRKPERSFFYKGKQFPFCARCTGMYIGYLSFFIFTFNVLIFSVWVSLFLLLPNLIDGLTQAFLKRESNNILRLITGLAAGVGIMSLVAITGKTIGDGILSFN